MSEDNHIESVIGAGERNLATLELIRNWCKHAGIEKFGGTGIIEAQTGLPIGHHSMTCDHAAAHGIASWDLGDAALDFYDRNCATCQMRSPRGLPNLIQLVEKRDRLSTEALRRRNAHEAEVALKSEKRRSSRAKLRKILHPRSLNIIDQLDELDQGKNENSSLQLIETARLAPEIFDEEIIAFFFELLEANESWFTRTGLRVVSSLNVDLHRTVKIAADVIARYEEMDVAAEILMRAPQLLDAHKVQNIFVATMHLARRSRDIFDSPCREDNPKLLVTLYEHHGSEIRLCIKKCLESSEPDSVRIAACAITILTDQDPTIAVDFARHIIAKLARAEALIDFHKNQSKQNRESLYSELKKTVAAALEVDPEKTDIIAAQFMRMSTAKAQARILGPYMKLLEARYGQRTEENMSHGVALKRLVIILTSCPAAEIFEISSSIFRRSAPEGLEGLVRRELPSLLGAAALLEPQRNKVLEEYESADDFLLKLEKNNSYSALVRTQEGLIDWCAVAAAEDPSSTKAYIDVLGALHEDFVQLRAIMTTSLSGLMGTSEGMNAALPQLYSSLMGQSQILRAAALKALQKIPSLKLKDLPDLIYETLITSLSDPYVIVHKEAVRVVGRVKPADEFKVVINSRVKNIILVYSKSKNDDDFLIKTMCMYISIFSTDEEMAGDWGGFLVQQMKRMDTDLVSRNIGWIEKKISLAKNFSSLAVNLLDGENVEHVLEKATRILRNLPRSAVFQERDLIERIVLNQITERDLVGAALELLTNSGAWGSAANLSQAALDNIEDTVKNRSVRLFFELINTSIRLELSISTGYHKQHIDNLTKQWDDVTTAIEKDRQAYEKWRDTPPSFPSAY